MKLGLYFDLRNPPRWRRPWPAVYGATLALCEEAERLAAARLVLVPVPELVPLAAAEALAAAAARGRRA